MDEQHTTRAVSECTSPENLHLCHGSHTLALAQKLVVWPAPCASNWTLESEVVGHLQGPVGLPLASWSARHWVLGPRLVFTKRCAQGGYSPKWWDRRWVICLSRSAQPPPFRPINGTAWHRLFLSFLQALSDALQPGALGVRVASSALQGSSTHNPSIPDPDPDTDPDPDVRPDPQPLSDLPSPGSPFGRHGPDTPSRPGLASTPNVSCGVGTGLGGQGAFWLASGLW